MATPNNDWMVETEPRFTSQCTGYIFVVYFTQALVWSDTKSVLPGMRHDAVYPVDEFGVERYSANHSLLAVLKLLVVWYL